MRQFKRMAMAATALAALLSAGNATAQWALGGNTLVTGTEFLGWTGADPTRDVRLYSNGVERGRILSGGNVGIGTTAPAQLLHIHSGVSNTAQIRLSETGESWELNAGSAFNFNHVNDGWSWMYFSPPLNKFVIGAGAELLVNTSNGRFGIGVQPETRLMVMGNVAPQTDRGGSLGTSTRKWNIIYACNGAINTSDARLKENIEEIPYGMEAVMNLRPVSFTWKEDPGYGRKLGLIAQEVDAVIGEAVKIGEDGSTMGIYYADLIPVLVKAVQEQQSEIEVRTAANETLRNQIAGRAARIARLEAALGQAQGANGTGTDAAE